MRTCTGCGAERSPTLSPRCEETSDGRHHFPELEPAPRHIRLDVVDGLPLDVQVCRQCGVLFVYLGGHRC